MAIIDLMLFGLFAALCYAGIKVVARWHRSYANWGEASQKKSPRERRQETEALERRQQEAIERTMRAAVAEHGRPFPEFRTGKPSNSTTKSALKSSSPTSTRTREPEISSTPRDYFEAAAGAHPPADHESPLR